MNATIASPAEVFKCALLANAARLIILHNHRRKSMLTY
ncbi:JAB domain-containing protein [Anaerosporobacter sp.]